MKFLIIQTAFLGDVVLATALVEKLSTFYPQARIDFVVRKGNESLLQNNPHLTKVYIFVKTESKYRNLFQLIAQIRAEKYDTVINVQRFATTGLMTVFSGAKTTVGFDKNRFSFLFSQKVSHQIGEGVHETARNQQLIVSLTDNLTVKPKIYPSVADYELVKPYQSEPYLCIAPASVWFTKQFPAEKWVEFLRILPEKFKVYLLGGKDDTAICEKVQTLSGRENTEILAGKLSLLASAALMQKAVMNYVNDSAPMHLCSAVEAPVCAVYCSTVPGFGFGPLSEKSFVVETEEKLTCRPCGLHGYKACPEGHFRCATGIRAEQLKNCL
jgi:heptosyltransferase II